MRIHLHNGPRRPLGWVEVDAAHPPRIARLGEQQREHEQFLDWDRAFNDEGHLRKCPVCGCEELYRRKALPLLSGFILVLVVAVAVVALWGVADAPLWLPESTLAAVIIANVLIYFFVPDFLVCYRCASRFHRVAISSQHGKWDAITAAKHDAAPPVTTKPHATAAD